MTCYMTCYIFLNRVSYGVVTRYIKYIKNFVDKPNHLQIETDTLSPKFRGQPTQNFPGKRDTIKSTLSCDKTFLPGMNEIITMLV